MSARTSSEAGSSCITATKVASGSRTISREQSRAVEGDEMKMARIGFLGLGDMGTPMARRLLRAGYDMTVWNRSAGRSLVLVQEGATLASSPAQVATRSDFVITMLSPPDALEE